MLRRMENCACLAYLHHLFWLDRRPGLCCSRTRLGDRCAVHLGKGRQCVNLASGRADDFLNAKTVYQQSVGNQRAMTTPRHRLGAHQRHAFMFCQFYQECQVLREFCGLHVIGVTAEGSVSPTGIDRLRSCVTEPSHARSMFIMDAGGLQRRRQVIPVELRVMAERGTVRTSTSRVTEWAESSARNSVRGRVECPTVNTTGWACCFTMMSAKNVAQRANKA